MYQFVLVILRCVQVFPISTMAKFNRKGTSLVIDVGSLMATVIPVVEPSMADAVSGEIWLSAQGFSLPDVGKNLMCFAGRDDAELVVSASKDYSLYVWSLPEKLECDQSVKPLFALRGHAGGIYSVRYDPCSDTLASAGAERIIKLWTPSLRNNLAI